MNGEMIHIRLSEFEKSAVDLAINEALEKRPFLTEMDKVNASYSACQNFKHELSTKNVESFDLLKRRKSIKAIFIDNLPSGTLDFDELLVISISSILGMPFQYIQQNEGKLAGHVTIRCGSEGRNDTSEGSSYFPPHTDDRAIPDNYRCEFISLLGVRNSNRIKTLIIPLESILDKLETDEIESLLKPAYRFKVPYSFGFLNEIWSEPLPILTLTENDQYRIGLPTPDWKTVHPFDERSRNAAEKVIQVAEALDSIPLVIEQGNMVIFDNDRVLHSREAVTGDRLLLRVYTRSSLTSLRQIARTSTENIYDAWPLIIKPPLKVDENF